MLLGVELPPPQDIAADVDLLLFRFTSSQKDTDKVNSVESLIEKNNFCCSSIGSASNASAATLSQWWR